MHECNIHDTALKAYEAKAHLDDTETARSLAQERKYDALAVFKENLDTYLDNMVLECGMPSAAHHERAALVAELVRRRGL